MKKFLSILLAVMMVLSTVSFAAPSAVGTYDAGVEAPVQEVAPAELSAESAHGTLLFDLDFESDAFSAGNLGSGGSIKYYSSKEQPTLPEAFDDYYAFVGNTIECAYVDTDGYEINYTNTLKVYAPTNPSYPHVAVQALKDSSTWDKDFPGFPDGTYTIVVDAGYDYNNSKPAIIQARFADNGSLSGGSAIGEQWTMNYAEGQLDTYTVTFDVINHADGTTKVIAADGTEKEYATIKSMGVYFGQLGNNPDFIYIDNFQMYWKPNSVNVTIKNNGETIKTISATTKGLLVSDLVKEAGIGADYSITEVKIDGVKKLLSETVVFGADAVVEITSEKLDLSAFEDAEKGKLLFNVTFEDYAIGTQLNSDGHSTNGDIIYLTDSYKTPYADSLMSHDLTEWGLFDQNAEYSIMADPKNPANKVIGVENITSTAYPHFRIDTSVDNKGTFRGYAWGFVEEDDAVFTLEYDVMDVNGNLATTDRFGGRSSVADVVQGKDKWTELEDLPTENSPVKVPNEYRTRTSVYSTEELVNLGSTAEVSFIKIHASKPVANSYYVDNVKLWYKPGKVDITVKHIGVDLPDEVVKDVKTSGVTAAEFASLINTSGIDTTVNKIVGISFDEDGSDPVNTAYFTGDTTVYLVWETIDMSEWIDEKGTILFSIDFEDPRAASVFTYNTAYKDYKLVEFAKVNPYVPGYEKWAVSTSGMHTIGIEDGALKVRWDGTGKWPQILIGNPENKPGNVFMGENGTYTVHQEFKLVDSVDSNLVSIALTANGLKDGAHQGPSGLLPMGQYYYAKDLEANKWFTIEGSKSTWDNDTDGIDNDDINKITTVFTHGATSTPGNYYLLDNIKLYWKPATVDVTVKNVGVDLADVVLNDVSTAGVSVNDILARIDTSSVNGAKYRVKGISMKADGSELISTAYFGANTTIYLVWEEIDMSAWTDENGVLLYEVNFDNLANGATIAQNSKISASGANINPNFANLADLYWNLSQYGDAVVENGVLKLTKTGKGKWPQVQIRIGDGKSIMNDGVIYATADMKLGLLPEQTAKVSFGLTSYAKKWDGTKWAGTTNDQGSFKTYSSPENNKWYTVDGHYKYEDKEYNGFECIICIPTYSAESTLADNLYLDNLKLYWRPATVKVTVDAGEGDAPDATFEMSTYNTKVEDVMANVADWGSYKLVGLSYTEGGEAIPEGTLLTPAVDTTYYAIWEEYGSVLETYGAEFNGKEYGEELGFATYGVGADDFAVFNYSKFTYQDEDGTSYMSIKSIPGEGSDGLIDTQIKLNAKLPKNTIKGLAVRMRYSNWPNENFTVVTPDRTYEDYKVSILEVFKAYLDVAGMGLAESRSIHANKNFTTNDLDGKWFTLYFDLSDKDYLINNDLNGIRIDIPDAFPAGAIVDIDYIRLYGDASELPDKPVSKKDAVAMRANATDTANNGLRFKAEMSGETNAVATSYGWVVCDAEKSNTKAITIGLNKNVLTYYGRKDGADLVKFFEETDDVKTFTAVVRNFKPEWAKKAIVIRPFVIVDGIEYYGEPMAQNVYDIAVAIKDGGYVGADKDYIDSFIAAVDALQA